MAQRKYLSRHAKCQMKLRKQEKEAQGRRTIDSFIDWSNQSSGAGLTDDPDDGDMELSGHNL